MEDKVTINYIGSKEKMSDRMRAYFQAWLESTKYLDVVAQAWTKKVWVKGEVALLIERSVSAEIEKTYYTDTGYPEVIAMVKKNLVVGL